MTEQPKRFEKGHPLPRSIGLCADEYHEVRDIRLAMEKDVEKVKERETELREHIIGTLSKSDDTGAAGRFYRAQVLSKDAYRATDWGQVQSYIQQTGRFDLLQKRLGEKAVAEMYAAGELPPGIEHLTVPDLSITKI